MGLARSSLGFVRLLAALFAAVTLVLAAWASAASAGQPAVAAGDLARPAWTKNCTALNRKFPHGVGRRLARDRTSGDPVTNFRRSTLIYNQAMRWNKGLDRDKDGVACEKH